MYEINPMMLDSWITGVLKEKLIKPKVTNKKIHNLLIHLLCDLTKKSYYVKQSVSLLSYTIFFKQILHSECMPTRASVNLVIQYEANFE